MNVYDQILDPTVISHSTTCHFTSLERSDLIVAKTSVLQIFHVEKSKLKLVNEFLLEGTITGLAPIKVKNEEYECLMVATRTAKLSVVKYDHKLQTLETLSMHYYEDKFQELLFETPALDSQLRMDTHCALLYNNDILAFLPFVGEDDEEESAMFFKNSIVMPVSKLQEEMRNIIDIQFLPGFRNPTIAVLYEPKLTWAGNAPFLKDSVKYVILSLNLENESSTVLLSADPMVYGMQCIVPLQKDGCLVIGVNEVVYIDNSGASRILGLNAFHEMTNKSIDKRSSNLFLEGTQAQVIDNSRIVLVSKDGEVFLVTVVREGRLIKTFDIARVDINLTSKFPSTMALLENNVLVGFRAGDNVLLQFESMTVTDDAGESTAANADDEDLLYEQQDSVGNSLVKFIVADTMFSLGSISNFTLAQFNGNKVGGLDNVNKDDTTMVASTGYGESGALSIIAPSIQPVVKSSLKFTDVTKVWSLRTTNDEDQYLVTTDIHNFKSDIFVITKNYQHHKSSDFKSNAVTLDICVMGNRTRIVQITSTSCFLYDTNFRRVFTVNFDFEVVHASILDPYILITNTKGEIKIFELEDKKFTKVKLPEILKETIVTSGSISKSKVLHSVLHKGHGTKRTSNDEIVVQSEEEDILFTLVTGDNQVIMFNKFHNDKVYQLNGIDQGAEMLYSSLFQLNDTTPDPYIKQVMINKLGQDFKEEYLSVLTFGGEIYLYKLNMLTSRYIRINNTPITGAPDNAYPQGTAVERSMTYVEDLQGYSAIFVTGKPALAIMVGNQSIPRIHKFTSLPILSFAKFNDSLMFIDDSKAARICELSLEFNYDNKLSVKKHLIGQTVNVVSFHERSKLFLISVLKESNYECIDENGDVMLGVDPEKPPAQTYTSELHLINPLTWNVIDRVEYESNHVINDIKAINLQLNARLKRFKESIVVGVSRIRDEDMITYGQLFIYDIIDIVPEPGKPDTNFKLKELFQESFKGPVTSVCGVSGRFLSSQGQRCLVRDLQEDNSVVPVAFADVPIYLTDAKSFGNFVILGDALKSIQFYGFDAEPYRMIQLGKDLLNFEVANLEFIVHDGDMQFMVADKDYKIHIMKFAPDDPNSLSGQRLIPATTFKTGSKSTKSALVPLEHIFNTNMATSYQAVGANVDGSMFKVVPVSEATYRRLYVVQQQLIEKESHLCGLNPRMHRLVDSSTKPMLDLALVKRFVELNIDRRRYFASKVGRLAYPEIWKDLITCELSLNSLSP